MVWRCSKFSNPVRAKHSGTKYWFLAEIYRPNAMRYAQATPTPLHQFDSLKIRPNPLFLIRIVGTGL